MLYHHAQNALQHESALVSFNWRKMKNCLWNLTVSNSILQIRPLLWTVTRPRWHAADGLGMGWEQRPWQRNHLTVHQDVSGVITSYPTSHRHNKSQTMAFSPGIFNVQWRTKFPHVWKVFFFCNFLQFFNGLKYLRESYFLFLMANPPVNVIHSILQAGQNGTKTSSTDSTQEPFIQSP